MASEVAAQPVSFETGPKENVRPVCLFLSLSLSLFSPLSSPSIPLVFAPFFFFSFAFWLQSVGIEKSMHVLRRGRGDAAHRTPII